MNIKILEPIKEELVIATFPFGSRVYGTHRADSDRDYVKLLKHNTGDLVLQYKNIDNDYIYIGNKEFFESIINGKSTINFETLHTTEFSNHFKGFKPAAIDFYTIKMARAYIGLAKRDIEYPERLFHVNRCIWMAEKIMKKELIVLSDVANIPLRENIGELKKEIKEYRNFLIQNVNITT